ncbi:hypothetical protein AAVH_23738 [Aphelenchoides avenae]|nr:hypothetical protein AAVH_23738 [Aphelenchus avenae]
MATYANLTNVPCPAGVQPPQPAVADDPRHNWISVPSAKFLDFHIARTLGIDTANRRHMDDMLSWCINWSLHAVAHAIYHQVVVTPYHEYTIAETVSFVSANNLAFLGPGHSMTLIQWLREKGFDELEHPEWPLIQLHNYECWPIELLRMANL